MKTTDLLIIGALAWIALKGSGTSTKSADSSGFTPTSDWGNTNDYIAPDGTRVNQNMYDTAVNKQLDLVSFKGSASYTKESYEKLLQSNYGSNATITQGTNPLEYTVTQSYAIDASKLSPTQTVMAGPFVVTKEGGGGTATRTTTTWRRPTSKEETLAARASNIADMKSQGAPAGYDKSGNRII